MFNFTTQTVYNYINDTEGDPKRNLWVVEEEGVKPSVRIGNTRFDKEDVLDIQVKMPTEENLAKVTFDLSEVVLPNEGDVAEGTARVVLYISLSMNSQDALYANDLVYKGKPLFIEIPVKKGETATQLATKAVSIAKKYFLFTMQEKILDVIDNGDGTITFSGVNGYQQIKKAVLQKFDPEAKTVDCCTNQGEYVDVLVGVPVIYTTDETGKVEGLDSEDSSAEWEKLGADGTPEELADNEVAILPGLEAFGDYNWIIHNLRLPTAANTSFWSPTNRAGEMPVPGASYVQVIIRICKQRDGIMGEIVGARGTSVTTHVLYVEKNAYDNYLDDVIATLADEIKTDADDKLQKPFGEDDSESSPQL